MLRLCLLLLLACLRLGCGSSDAGQSPDSGGSRRVRREDVSVEDVVRAAAAEFESRARAAINETVARLEERLDGLEKHLTEHSARLDEAVAALRRLSGAVSELESGGRQTVVSTSADRSDGMAAGRPLPSDRPRHLMGRVLGEPCRRDSECSDLLTDTTCYGGRCVCGPGLVRGPAETCRPAPWLGGECRINRHCRARTKDAICSNRVCQCPSNRMTYLERCLPFPRLTEKCITDADCRSATKHARCRLTWDGIRRCQCPPRYWNYRNRQCRKGVASGGRCQHNRDCSIVKKINTCIDGVCQVRECDARPDLSDRFRLIGGNSCSNGYVQFTYDSGQSWNFVCDSNWTEADATVLCAYMGFDWGEPRRPNEGSTANITRFLWLNDLVCDGSEPSPTLCVWIEGRTNCERSDVANVECFLRPTEPPTTDPPATGEPEYQEDGDDDPPDV